MAVTGLHLRVLVFVIGVLIILHGVHLVIVFVIEIIEVDVIGLFAEELVIITFSQELEEIIRCLRYVLPVGTSENRFHGLSGTGFPRRCR